MSPATAIIVPDDPPVAAAAICLSQPARTSAGPATRSLVPGVLGPAATTEAKQVVASMAELLLLRFMRIASAALPADRPLHIIWRRPTSHIVLEYAAPGPEGK